MGVEVGRTRVRGKTRWPCGLNTCAAGCGRVAEPSSKVKEPVTAAFIEEAIRCYEQQLYRAAVVLSWVGAVSVLYHLVVSKHLAAFNAEATRRHQKWKPATTPDDISRMKEKDFLDILDHMSVIGKNVKQELEGCLALRNGCGHPNSLAIGEHRVAGHVETLLLNVFVPFTRAPRLFKAGLGGTRRAQ